MSIDKSLVTLIAELEYLVGSQCYNPNSYDGWNHVEGCDFRYPINIKINDHEDFIKIRNNILRSYIPKEEITLDALKYMKYKFGSNELFIGLGIIDILEFLENRYNLDFSKLEKEYNKKLIVVRQSKCR